MELNLTQIPRVKTLTKEVFLRDYFRPQKPVVIENCIEDWPAFEKWDLEYMKKVAGDKEVPLYDDRPVKHDEGFNEPHAIMKMADYIDLLKSEPTKYRIFLWNVLKEVPILQEDFTYPNFGIRLMKGLPMLFFGGRNSHTFMHYDIDLANIFHFHFAGKKQCILFSQSESKHLYKIPHSLITREDIDFDAPDFEQWPALKNAKGHIAHLQHGNVLYIPEGYWHHMKYITPGFSMSLRAVARKPKNFLRAVYNIFFMRYYDNFMRRRKGQEWIDWKNEEVVKRTNGLMRTA